MRPAFEDLIDRVSKSRERVEVYERTPPVERVASKDILRRDALGRTVVACPRGTVPPAWLELTAEERDSLVDPPPPLPTGYMHPSGPFGFWLEGVRIGFVVDG